MTLYSATPPARMIRQTVSISLPGMATSNFRLAIRTEIWDVVWTNSVGQMQLLFLENGNWMRHGPG